MTDSKLDVAHKALTAALETYGNAISDLDKKIWAEDYPGAMADWKVGHEAVLKLKDAHNAIYKHLHELKPKKAEKLKPGGKLDNEPARDAKASKRDARRGRGAEQVDEQTSDEP